ncbi:MAG: DUF4190 domain-containing protein [Flavobacteriaceae bacterium]|nr:DUF4190 domain-containing protein [Flavobacteriaceae bacterium]
MEQQKLRNSTLILVLGIVSIVTCCCYGIIGLIAGIVALVLANNTTAIYAQNPEIYSDYQNVKIGKILAIIGIVLSVIYIVFLIWIITVFGLEAMQDQDLMQERLRDYLENN